MYGQVHGEKMHRPIHFDKIIILNIVKVIFLKLFVEFKQTLIDTFR